MATHYPLLESLSEKPGTYIGVRFTEETVEQLKQLQRDLEVPDPLDAAEFHSTVMYSKHIPNIEALGSLDEPKVADPEMTIELWPSNSGKKTIAVLKYKCDWLTERHEELMEHPEATWDHDDFIPHVTLSYNVGDWKPSDTSITFEQPIEIDEEYHEDLDPDW